MKRKTLRRKRQIRKTRKRRGGVKLGEGGFGRVYAPGMLCKGTPAEVTKVFDIGREMTHEGAMSTIRKLKVISAKLEEIDRKQDFFLYPEFCDEEPTLSEENKKDKLTIYDIPISYNMRRADKTLREAYKAEFDEADKMMDTIYESEDMDILRRKYRPEAEALADKFVGIFGKVKTLLDKLHNIDIVHNDMSSQNVMVMKDGTYRLIDFDLSRINSTPLEPFQKRDEMKTLVSTSLMGWSKVYPDLYTRMVNSPAS